MRRPAVWTVVVWIVAAGIMGSVRAPDARSEPCPMFDATTWYPDCLPMSCVLGIAVCDY